MRRMSRAARLMDLIQALRRHRRPVTAEALAAELGVSTRTIYRDIATLCGQGAPIEGEAGLGYVLKPGFLLPPLMFADEELEALVFGLRLAAERGDPALARAAADAGAKISAVLPDDLREQFSSVGLFSAPPAQLEPVLVDLALLRAAIRRERKLALAYRDAEGRATSRVVWPIALGYFERVRVLAAWCETRAAFRHFRVDRMAAAELIDERPPKRRAVLLKDWRETERGRNRS
jgi:predicted DNA-binding transcriptional regulator YafY